ncbi:MAG: hypothetical protein ACRDRH_00015 [Pseudonocardia sp.]
MDVLDLDREFKASVVALPGAAPHKFFEGLKHAVGFMITEGERGAPSRTGPRTETVTLAGHRDPDGAMTIGEEPGTALRTANGT